MTFDRKTTARSGAGQEMAGSLVDPLHAPEEVLRTMFAESNTITQRCVAAHVSYAYSRTMRAWYAWV